MRALEDNKRVCFAIFSVYILAVLKLTVFRFHTHYGESAANLVPMTDLIKIYRNAGAGLFLLLFLGNIGWFVPFGFLLPALLKRGGGVPVVFSGFLFSLAIETSQYLFRKGVAEVDDLILNTVGTAIGYGLFRLYRAHRRS